jgi:3-hydroxybutyryl-CoA dehydratase
MNQLNGYDVEDLRVGMSASFSKTITEADLVLFAGVSGDNNARHVNEFAAALPLAAGSPTACSPRA